MADPLPLVSHNPEPLLTWLRQWDRGTQFRIVMTLARLAPGNLLDLPPAINDASLSPIDVVIVPFITSARNEMQRLGAVLALVAWMDAICASEEHPDFAGPQRSAVASHSAPISDEMQARMYADALLVIASVDSRWREMVRSWRATRTL